MIFKKKGEFTRIMPTETRVGNVVGWEARSKFCWGYVVGEAKMTGETEKDL